MLAKFKANPLTTIAGLLAGALAALATTSSLSPELRTACGAGAAFFTALIGLFASDAPKTPQ